MIRSERELYTWQKECLKAWEKNNYHGIVNVVTGAGKTVLAIAAAMALADKLAHKGKKLRIRVVVPTSALARQWRVRLTEDLPLHLVENGVGQYGGNRRDSAGRNCMVYVINSARYTLARQLVKDMDDGYEVLLIADECHHYASPENRKIFAYQYGKIVPIRAEYRPQKVYTLGLSATPNCQDYESVLEPSLGKEIYRYGFEEGARQQTVSPFLIGQVSLSFTSAEAFAYTELSDKMNLTYRKLLQEYPGLSKLSGRSFFKELRGLAQEEEELPIAYLHLSYQRAALSQTAAGRTACASRLVTELRESERILIFSERIEQAEELYVRLRELYPGRIGRYHSELSSTFRKIQLERFRDGDIRILITCKAMDEGIDVPDVTVGIVMSCTGTSRQRIQRLGRILRRSAGKESAVLYYLSVQDSMDDTAYLPDKVQPRDIFSLQYDAESDGFSNEEYAKKADALYIKLAGPLSEEQRREFRCCLQEGLARADWLLPMKFCEGKVRTSESQHERNYWICMKHLSRS